MACSYTPSTLHTTYCIPATWTVCSSSPHHATSNRIVWFTALSLSVSKAALSRHISQIEPSPRIDTTQSLTTGTAHIWHSPPQISRADFSVHILACTTTNTNSAIVPKAGIALSGPVPELQNQNRKNGRKHPLSRATHPALITDEIRLDQRP